MQSKSLTKVWKESGTDMSFKNFASVYNAHKNFDAGETITNTLNATKEVIKETIDKAKGITNISVVKEEDTSKVLGLNKKVVIFSTAIILLSVSFLLYKKLQKKA